MTDQESQPSQADDSETAKLRPWWWPPATALALMPLALFAVLAYFLYTGLFLKPREIPSVLLNKPIPAFTLPALEGVSVSGLNDADLKQGQVSLVNVFASWCGPCREEHPYLTNLAETLPIYGLNYKDEPENAASWLQRYGNPYAKIGSDRNGRVSIDWGVYGVPETFLIDQKGRIVCKIIGAITPLSLEKTLQPAIEAAQQGREVTC